MSAGKVLQEGSWDKSTLYVYQPHDTVPPYDDLYNRKLSRLLLSFARVAEKLLTERSFQGSFNEDRLSSIVRICTNQASPVDIPFLAKTRIFSRTKTSCIALVQARDNGPKISMEPPRNFRSLQQIVFLQFIADDKWIVVLLNPADEDSTNNRRIGEVFFNDGCNRKQIDATLMKLSNKLSEIYPDFTFTFQERLEIPANFEADPVILAYVIAVTLHRHGKYLDIDNDQMMKYKFDALNDFRNTHDKWLSKFGLHNANAIKYPFILDQEYQEKLSPDKVYNDNLDNLKAFGWKVLDVEGDGNCAYYAILLGLESLGNLDYHPRVTSTSSMDYKRSLHMWRSKVVKLRQDLHAHSRKLMRMKYLGKSYEELPEWWYGVSPEDNSYSEEVQLSLSNEFLHPKFKIKQYFTNLPEHLQFSVNWGPLVVASFFNVRVVIISRETRKTTLPDHKTTERESKKHEDVDMNDESKDDDVNHESKGDDVNHESKGDHVERNEGRDNNATDPDVVVPNDNDDTMKEVQPAEMLPTDCTYHWFTTIVDVLNPFDSDAPHLNKTVLDEIHCIPVDELKRVPTIEIVHTWAHPHVGMTPHYQFLFRVLYDNIPIPSEEHHPSIATLLSERKKREKASTTSSTKRKSKKKPTDNESDKKPRKSSRGKKLSIDQSIEEPGVNDGKKKSKKSQPNQNQGMELRLAEETRNPLEVSVNEPLDDTAMEPIVPVPAEAVQMMGNAEQQVQVEMQEPVEETGETAEQQVQVEMQEHPEERRESASMQVVARAARTSRRIQSMNEARIQSMNEARIQSINEARIQSINEARVERERRLGELQETFNDLFERGELTHRHASQMQYDPIERAYFIRYYDTDRREFTPRARAGSLTDYDERLVAAARECEGDWVGYVPGSAGLHDILPPQHLVTKVPTIPQGDNPYCFTYSLASALLYCGFQLGGHILPAQAIIFSEQHFDQAVSQLVGFMVNIAPTIARPTIYGRRTSRGFVRSLLWDDVFSTLTPYPTLIIPVLPDGSSPHAICVVDDLIFDSITSRALKLCKEALDWIFSDTETTILFALRFQTKESPKGTKVTGRYEREIVLHP